ncbi:hypothetical protein KY334_07980 [Candidatus Woesearchaeota archaeon]|nr:hypothetical protein [Candidatus Woesearchaeota archaeon]
MTLPKKDINIEAFLLEGEESTLLEEIHRELQIARWKEIYPKDFVLSLGVSLKEYDSIPTSNEIARQTQDSQQQAYLMHQVVGYEVGFK